MGKVLVVDDDPHVRSMLIDTLALDGVEAIEAEDGKAALDKLRTEQPQVVLLDLNMPGMPGMEVLPELKRNDPLVSVIILTASMDVAKAVQAIRLGAYDYLTKPCRTADLMLVIRRALERHELLTHVDELRLQVGKAAGLREQMGPSDRIRSVMHQVCEVADSTMTVLIQGETGTGKELVARAIHHASSRRARPFVALDCGAIPDTLIESELFGYERGAFSGADRRKEGHFVLAAAGTLFLDEIVNLPIATQVKLLRVLQERRVLPLGARGPVAVDVRIVAASNVMLDDEVRAGRFRQDLYYRLNEYPIVLPPLRERREDVAYLARRFLDEAAMELRRPVRGISDAALEMLLRHPWPGNVRELRNVIRHATIGCRDVIEPEHLALGGSARVSSFAGGGGGRSLKEIAQAAAADAEQAAIHEALEASGGNKAEAARALRTDYKTLHLKMKQYGIAGREYRSR